jgi:hypothetical protein
MTAAAAEDWHLQMKCAELSPEQADKIFFVKSGGKSKTAKLYCQTCPVVAECLTEKLKLGGPGFWAGTTEDERRDMCSFLNTIPVQVEDFIPERKRPRLSRIVKAEPRIDYLADLDGPTEEELRALDQ